MFNWPQQLIKLINNDQKVVMVTVIQVKGSTPREVGAKVLITSNQLFGTIGGGNLEYQAEKIAHEILSNVSERSITQRFSLAAGLGMCCGGTIELLFEPITTTDIQWLELWSQNSTENKSTILVTDIKSSEKQKAIILIAESENQESNDVSINEIQSVINSIDKNKLNNNSILIKTNSGRVLFLEYQNQTNNNLILFGAGHVGQAIVKLMQDFDWKITWVDSRDNCLDSKIMAQLPHQVSLKITEFPVEEVIKAPPNSFYLVMTHDHSLDLKLSEQILAREDARYFGLIGSKTKRKRFEHRLKAKGLSVNTLNKMICPIGINGINSKHAAAIALSSAAQLIQLSESNTIELSQEVSA